MLSFGGRFDVLPNVRVFAGWEFQGQLEVGKSKPCQDGEGYDLGAMWECPFFVSLSDPSHSHAEPLWLLCVSPYPHHCTDRPTNPCLYWLGSFQDERFQLGSAAGELSSCVSGLCSSIVPRSRWIGSDQARGGCNG